jgi:hypothetical protein
MDSSAIKEQINRVLRSQSFANKAQLRRLLEVLSASIDSQTTLTPDLVIKELWPDETRTKRSADVATEMNRLRNALESYYTEEGNTDPITIVLPNRATPAADGTHEKRWIVAKPRTEEAVPAGHAIEDRQPAPQAKGLSNRSGVLRIAAAITALCIVGLVGARMLIVHDQPHSARLDGSTLTIVNAEGKELWRKSFPEGFSADGFYEKGIATRIWIGDLEGDGHASVLFLYLPGVRPESHSSTLICYSDRGKEKWRWTPGRALPELGSSPVTYRTAALGVLKATEKKPRRIVVSSINFPWFPDQIAILDSHGRITSEYWHSGHLRYLALADLDGDGREEIVATGINNGYHQATLLVLDPDHLSGASAEPERPEVQLHGMGVARERLRLLFPRSDLNKALFAYNAAAEPTVEHGSIRLEVQECTLPPDCLVWYELNKDFRVSTAFAGEDFRKAHAEFYRTGKDAHPFSAEEEAEFRKVRCVVGCKTELVPFDTP